MACKSSLAERIFVAALKRNSGTDRRSRQQRAILIHSRESIVSKLALFASKTKQQQDDQQQDAAAR